MEWRREFTLYSDRIVVRGKHLLGSKFDVPIQLTQLNPDPATFFIRPDAFKAALASFAIGGTFASFIFLTKLEEWPKIFCTIAGILACFGFVVMILTFKKVEFIRFQASSRAHPTHS